MLKFILSFSIGLFSFSAWSQLILEDQDISHFDIDKLENLYVIRESKLSLYSKGFIDKEYEFSADKYGEISSLDVSNPHKLLLYYRDFQTLLLLDNTLAILDILNLDEYGFLDIKAVSLSNDNNLWILDDQNVRKVDIQGSEILSTEPLYTYNLGSEIKSLREEANQLYLEYENGLAVFDTYGQYIEFLEFPVFDNYDLEGGTLLYGKGSEIFVWSRASRFEAPTGNLILKANKKVLQTKLSSKHLYFRTEDGVFKHLRNNLLKRS